MNEIPKGFPARIDYRTEFPRSQNFTLRPEVLEYSTKPKETREVKGPVSFFRTIMSEDVLSTIIKKPFKVTRTNDPSNPMNLVNGWVEKNIEVNSYFGSKTFRLEQFYDSMMGYSFNDPAMGLTVAMQVLLPSHNIQFTWPDVDEMKELADRLVKDSEVSADAQNSPDLSLYTDFTYVLDLLNKKAENQVEKILGKAVFDSLKLDGYDVADDLKPKTKIFLPSRTVKSAIPPHEFKSPFLNQRVGFFTTAQVILTF